MNERGRPGIRAEGSISKNQKDTSINAPPYIGSIYRTETKNKNISGEGTIPLGKATVTLGGAYSSSEVTESLPENKINIPENVQKQIYKRLSAGLGYNITPDLKISGFIDQDKFSGNKNTKKTVQISGNVKGSRFVGSFSDSSTGEKVGRFSLVIPFAHGGKVKPRGRKATY